MRIIILIFSLLWSPLSFTQDREGLSVGVVAMSGNSIYKGVDTVFRLYPSLEYRKGPWELGLANGIKYKVVDAEKLELDMQLSPSFGPYDSSDSSTLSGMSRDATADFSIGSKYQIASGTSLSFRAGLEVTREYDGSFFNLSLNQFIFPLFGNPVFADLGVKGYDAKKSKYLYGVYDSEVISGRAAYSPGATTTPYLGINSFFPITDRISGFVRLNMDFLPSKVKDSPIVSESTSALALLGITTTF
jgi:outer membrane protein